MKTNKKEENDKGRREAYKENKRKLKYILGHAELSTVLGQQQQEVVKIAFGVMEADLDDLAADKPVKMASGKEKSQVKEALNLLLTVVINLPLSPILRDLALEFGLLSFNWNRTFGRRPDIDQTARDIKAVTLGSMSLVQALNVIKNLIARVKNIERFSPPAFELSKAYLLTLEKNKEL